MRTFATICRLVAGLAIAGGTVFVPMNGASAAEVPAASVRIHRLAFEGPRDSVLVDVSGRCAPGLEFGRLALRVESPFPDVPPSLGQAFPCDGEWHRQRLSTAEGPYEPGAAIAHARLRVDDANGDPVATATDAERIWIRAASNARIFDNGRLHDDGSATVRLSARCDPPWINPDMFVGATQYRQDGTSVFAGVSVQTLTCDGEYHFFRLRLDPPERNFRPGGLEVSVSITVYDEFGDPVAQSDRTKVVTISR
jgi:hypothetical protein